MTEPTSLSLLTIPSSQPWLSPRSDREYNPWAVGEGSWLLTSCKPPIIRTCKKRALSCSKAQAMKSRVLGNDNAIALDAAVIAAANVIVVGFSASHSIRAAMVIWFKTHYPKTPVIVLQFSRWERFPEADVSTFSEDPTILLAAVAKILRSAA
jgi:hypothetical protein